ncbi:hypothetical protein Tco_0340277 [Tanacetum coccineum]
MSILGGFPLFWEGFLKEAEHIIDVHREELILRDEDEQSIFHVDNTSKHPHESINMINFIDITCEDRFSKVLKFKKSNHPSSGSTTPFSDSLLEEFTNEITLLDPFPLGNKDDNFDPEAEPRSIDRRERRGSLIMGDEHLSTIPKMESDEVIKSSVEHLVPIPSDDESFLKEDVQEENFKIYSNLLFDFDNEYISSDVNPLFNEVLEDIKSKDSYVSNFDKPALLVTSLFDANKDECFDPRGDIDKINAFLDMDVSTDIEDGYYDSEGDIIYLKSLLINDTILNLPPEVFLDHNSRSLKDEPDNNDLKSMVKVVDPDHETIIS